MESLTLRPTADAVGFHVMVTSTDYDMRDRGGQQGVTHKLWLGRLDRESGKPLGCQGFKIKPEMLAALLALKLGQPLTVEAVGFTNVRGQSAVTEWHAVRVIKGDSGEIVAEQSTRAAA